MITLILTIHLLLAGSYTLSIVGLIVAAITKKTAPVIKTSAITSFVGTIGSGVLLVTVSPKAMATFCTSAFIASVCGIAAGVLYKKRVTSLQPLQSELY